MTIIMSTLFPPKLNLRPRSMSNVSIISSRSPTPASSAPSTPTSATTPRFASEIARPPRLIEFIGHIANFIDYLDAPDILNLSSVSRAHQCRGLRSSGTYLRQLDANGWDIQALERRAEIPTDSNARPWMLLARSALSRARIASTYPSLPKEGDRTSQQNKKAAQKFFRTVLDIALEHDDRNFRTIASLASALGLSLIRFVTNVRAPDWKTRYQKTFFIATLINSQPPHLNAVSDLEALAQTLDFEESRPPPLQVATRANFLYAYGCTSLSVSDEVPSAHLPLPSAVYDPPYGAHLPGVQHALDRFKVRIVVDGFYRRSGSGEIVSLRMNFEPHGLASQSRLPGPFADKNLLTLTATMTEGDSDKPWDCEGFFSLKAGVGKFKTSSREICYEIWITPWGLVGEKIRRGNSSHLGYFVLHWT